MNTVEIREVTKRFGPVTVLHDVSLVAGEGEFVSCLGPSGCGKTTLLRIIAGFEDPNSGAVLIRGQKVNRLPPYQRDIGMVFQQYALFPHKSVSKNIEFGLRYRSAVPAAGRPSLVKEALRLVRMPGYEVRRPRELSGGEQQRVALARALATRPSLLLLDEPLSNLDAELRAEMRVELKRIHEEVGITFIYVTHDREEALSMSDRVAIMRSGRMEQVGSPREVYERPAYEHIARFMGQSNVLRAVVEGVDDDVVAARLQSGEVIGSRGPEGLQKGAEVGVVVRAESVKLKVSQPGSSQGIWLTGIVQRIQYQGGRLDVTIRLGNSELIHAEVPNCECPRLEPRQEVYVSFALDGTWIVRREPEGDLAKGTAGR